MNYKIEIHDGFICVRFERDTLFTLELITDVLNQERNSTDRLALNDIWDVRGAKVDKALNSEAIELIVQHIKKLHADVYHKRSALVIDSKVALGMTRMFQILSDDLPYESQAFEDIQAAKDWILGDTAT
jgi:RecA-family ATPase